MTSINELEIKYINISGREHVETACDVLNKIQNPCHLILRGGYICKRVVDIIVDSPTIERVVIADWDGSSPGQLDRIKNKLLALSCDLDEITASIVKVIKSLPNDVQIDVTLEWCYWDPCTETGSFEGMDNLWKMNLMVPYPFVAYTLIGSGIPGLTSLGIETKLYRRSRNRLVDAISRCSRLERLYVDCIPENDLYDEDSEDEDDWVDPVFDLSALKSLGQLKELYIKNLPMVSNLTFMCYLDKLQYLELETLLLATETNGELGHVLRKLRALKTLKIASCRDSVDIGVLRTNKTIEDCTIENTVINPFNAQVIQRVVHERMKLRFVNCSVVSPMTQDMAANELIEVVQK